MKFIKRLYKRAILIKWMHVIVWRVLRKRTVYPFHDIPYTALRFVRWAIHCTLIDEEEMKTHKNTQRIQEIGNVTMHLINEELNIRHMKLKRTNHASK